ncbi:acyl-CoA dehydrogenase family protein [Kribbia dieselivorans]|uniref:acyl-CoA dehydrogenase family protein n=1 Tax=Kribbia dieselivorans TaxID=331526 RepID=UPI000838AA12|nr:acyl-CoA dehydrogenase family protein [Kribbia dieselivorans]
MNFADRDPALRPLLDSLLSPADRARIEPVIAELGAVAADEIDALAATADRNQPQLRQFDRDGQRIDEIDYHPSYERMCDLAYGRYGLAAMSHHGGVHGWETKTPAIIKYALSYLFVQSEFGLMCPVSMTDSAARVLRLFDPENFPDEIAALSSTDMDTLATGAMFMTERQGGTDVGLTDTIATDHGDHWTLAGDKWFCSNVSADVILTLARVPGQGEGTRGLGMFLVPKHRPDGSRNAYRINRLKEKLGTKSMASGEVTLEGAWARPVGDLTRGFLQMAEMLNVSRLSNAMRASGLMRRAVRESIDHTRERVVFGKPLFDQPLMRATLLPLMVDAEAALGMVFEAALQLEASDAGDETARTLIRILTPMAKHTICKRARTVTGEAMEVRGGNGYIEDWVNARLVRDSHLGSIWEGSSNVIALDVLRSMNRKQAHVTLVDTFVTRLDALTDPAVRPAADVLRRRWEDLLERSQEILAASAFDQEAAAGAHTDDLSHTVMATLLLEQAQREIAAGLGHRKLLVAHTYLQRLLTGTLLGAPALHHLEVVADGGSVDADTAAEAFAFATRAEVSAGV